MCHASCLLRKCVTKVKQFKSFSRCPICFEQTRLWFLRFECFAQMCPVDQSTGQELSSPLVYTASLDQPQVNSMSLSLYLYLVNSVSLSLSLSLSLYLSHWFIPPAFSSSCCDHHCCILCHNHHNFQQQQPHILLVNTPFPQNCRACPAMRYPWVRFTAKMPFFSFRCVPKTLTPWQVF